MAKVILINTASCGIWRDEVESVLNKKVYKEDIYYLDSATELVRISKLPKPFFSKYYLVYLTLEDNFTRLSEKDFDNDFSIYIITTKNIKLYDDIKCKISIMKEFNSYLLNKDIIKSYIRRHVPRHIDDNLMSTVLKKLGTKINKIDDVVLKLTNGETIPNYSTITVEKLLFCVLMRQVNIKCVKLIYNYRYNAEFLIDLINNVLTKLIEFKIKYNIGEVNALSKLEKCKEFNMVAHKMDSYVSLCEKVSLEEFLRVQSLLKKKKNNFDNYITLQKFLKGDKSNELL